MAHLFSRIFSSIFAVALKMKEFPFPLLANPATLSLALRRRDIANCNLKSGKKLIKVDTLI